MPQARKCHASGTAIPDWSGSFSVDPSRREDQQATTPHLPRLRPGFMELALRVRPRTLVVSVGRIEDQKARLIWTLRNTSAIGYARGVDSKGNAPATTVMPNRVKSDPRRLAAFVSYRDPFKEYGHATKHLKSHVVCTRSFAHTQVHGTQGNDALG